MTLQVHTARLGTRDPDVLDITRQNADATGIVFAPSWTIVRPVLDLRAKLQGLSEGARNAEREGLGATARDLRRQAADVEREIDIVWDQYVGRYTQEMRASYKRHRATWEAVLARERVVLVCFCTDHAHCHRTLLARDILPTLGAKYEGELAREVKQASLFGGGS